MADSSEQVPPTGAASLAGKAAPEEVKQGDDPLSSSQKAGPPDSDVDGAQSSLTSTKSRSRSGALSQQTEEATTVGGGYSGATGEESDGDRVAGGGGGDGATSTTVTYAPRTIMNGML